MPVGTLERDFPLPKLKGFMKILDLTKTSMEITRGKTQNWALSWGNLTKGGSPTTTG